MSEPTRVHLTLTVNGSIRKVTIDQDESLLHVVRNKFGLIGSKEGCGMGECGACTVLVNSKPVMSCLTLAILAADKDVVTIEGIEQHSLALRRAFADRGAFQCGFCTSGQIVRANALLADTALKTMSGDARERYIRKQMSGNICRCTGYNAIVDAILDVARSQSDSFSDKGPQA